MKRVGISIAAVLVVLVGTVLAAPSFIDWTDYRTTFEERIAAATGRSVAIDGDVSLSILPRPAFRVGLVRVGSIPGAQDDDFLTAEIVDVNLAFGSLLAGQLQFVSIDIIEPIISAEVLADGRVTWLLTPSGESGASDSVQSDESGLSLAVDRMSITDGTIKYMDVQAGVAYQVTGIVADLSAQSLAGPYAFNGSASVDGKAWQYGLSIGALQEGRPSSLSVSIAAAEDSVVGKFTGQFTLSENAPSGSGRLTVSGANGARVFSDLGLLDAQTMLPKPLRQPFEITSRMSFDASSVSAKDIEIEVGEVKVGGSGFLAFGGQPKFDISLKAGRLNLSPWLETGSITPTDHQAFDVLFGVRSTQAQTESETGGFVLPGGISGTIDMRVDLIEWRGQVMRNGVFAASLAESELTVTDLSLEVPGNSALSVTGFIKEDNGQPTFDLLGEMSSRNLRGLLAWIDVEPESGIVPPGRLNSLSASSRITGSPDQLNLEDLTVTLDTTTLTGSASYQSGVLGRVDVNLAVSQLDLDSYVPALRGRLTASETASVEGGVRPKNSGTKNDKAKTGLTGTDAHVSLSVGTLTAAGNIIRGLNLDAALESGVLKIKNASADNLAGARVALEGEVRDAAGNADFRDFKFSVVTENLARTATTLALDVPSLPALSGPATLSGQAAGTLDAISFRTSGRLSDFTLEVEGNVASLSGVPTFDIKSTIKHPNYAVMMAGLGVRLPDANRPLGNVMVVSAVTGDASLVSVSDLSVTIDDNAFGGAIEIRQVEERVSISGSVNVTRAELDRLYPADPTEELTRASRGRSSSGSGAVSGRWSTEPFDLSAFAAVDANLDVTAKYVSGRGLVVEDVTAPLTLSNGMLNVPSWRGQVYGGPASGDISISINSPVTVQTRLEIKDALVDRIGGAFSASSSASGKASLAGAFATQGTNQRDLVSNLSGQGAFAASGLDANKAGQGAFAQLAMAPVRALSQLGGLLGGGVTDGFASMGARFTGTNGVFELTDATLKSNVYSGEFSGTIDLPRWRIESDGKVRLEANLITQLLGNRLQMPSLIPISVSGSLDAPNVKMDTGGGVQAQQPTSVTPAQPSAPAREEKPNPLDLFQGILNELAKPQ